MWRLLRIVALVGAVACHTKTLEPLPLQIGITATPTNPAVGARVDFVVTAQGDNLVLIHVSYGDTATEDFVIGGARTAHVTFSHEFTAAGTYEVRATITDIDAFEKSASVNVVVH